MEMNVIGGGGGGGDDPPETPFRNMGWVRRTIIHNGEAVTGFFVVVGIHIIILKWTLLYFLFRWFIVFHI